MTMTRNEIAQMAARDLWDGAHVNLGIGTPILVAKYIPVGVDVVLQGENGILGFGPEAEVPSKVKGAADAGDEPVVMRAGGSFFDVGLSFAMIRGGHLDLSLLGCFEVAANGDLASWDLGDGTPASTGGAMDLAFGAKAVWVLAEHRTSKGKCRIVKECSLPVTAKGVVTRIYSDIGVFDVNSDAVALTARYLPQTISIEQVREILDLEVELSSQFDV